MHVKNKEEIGEMVSRHFTPKRPSHKPCGQLVSRGGQFGTIGRSFLLNFQNLALSLIGPLLIR